MRSATRSSGAILTRLSPSTYSLWRARRQGLGIAIGGAVELGNALSSSWACSRNCSPPPVGVCGSPCSNGACSGARNQFSCESLFQNAHDRFAIASRHGAVRTWRRMASRSRTNEAPLSSRFSERLFLLERFGPRCGGRASEPAHEQKDYQDQNNKPQSAARVIAPAAAVGPRGKGSDEQQDHDN
jgi:hypothetical protein